MIEILELTKRFGEKTAVDRLTLTVPAGECFACLGPNAAGKTTTIKLLTGLLRPTAGAIRIGGVDIAAQPLEAKRLIGYIPDVAHLYEKLTGEEFLQFVGGLYGLAPSALGEAIERWLARFRLLEARDELLESYSHGMRQRLVVAAALIHAPRVLIIDEPMVGLDPQSAREFRRVLREQAADGVTIFLSTHTLSLAEEVASRIGIMDHGTLVALGTLEELRASSGTAGRLEEVFLRLTRDQEEGPSPR